MGRIKYELIPTDETSTRTENLTPRLLIKLILVCFITLLIVACYNWTNDVTGEGLPAELTIATEETKTPTIYKNYYVFTSKCHMPAANPFAKDALKIYHKTPYKKCAPDKDLLSLNYDEDTQQYSLHMNEDNITCCYKPIQRAGSGAQADNKYKLLPCSNFHQDFVIPRHVENLITQCFGLKNKHSLQNDSFSLVQPKKHLDFNETERRRPSILLWGIDSLSRMNFQRTMPLMYKYLRAQNWYELQGYNKMADNTFPNLLAILTGFNNSRSQLVCRPKVVGGLDSCPLVWKNFKEHGYMTGFAEDWVKFSTFNYNKKGFVKPPTDYYQRPFIVAVEKELKKQILSDMPYCVGRRHAAEFIYDSAIQFTRVYKNQSSFGMFWTNTFSHSNFSLPSSMDNKMVEYMDKLQSEGIFNSSIVLFFSDHGMRFGPLRSLDSGFLEERLPIMYIWLPDWFKQEYPEFAASLHLNRNRLTSPFDIHATLKHLLELETPFEKLPKPESCPNCHSIFYEAAESRDCKEAGVDDYWCACSLFKQDSPKNKRIRDVTQQIIDATNAYLEGNNFAAFCRSLTLSKIESAQKKHSTKSKTLETYIVRFEVDQKKALFEATADWNTKTQQISVNVPDISRLDSYNQVSQCIKDSTAKKFCICYK